MWYVTKMYQRDMRGKFQSQIEIYSPGFSSIGIASDEAARLNRNHHDYMLATHDLDEQGVEFDCMPDDDSRYSFGQARQLGIRVVKSDAKSHAWERWFNLPAKERAEVTALLRAMYYIERGYPAEAEADLDGLIEFCQAEIRSLKAELNGDSLYYWIGEDPKVSHEVNQQRRRAELAKFEAALRKLTVMRDARHG